MSLKLRDVDRKSDRSEKRTDAGIRPHDVSRTVVEHKRELKRRSEQT